MEYFTDLNNKKDVLNSISVLEKGLSEKIGKNVAIIAYNMEKYATLNNDANALMKITELEKVISEKTGKDVALVAFSV